MPWEGMSSQWRDATKGCVMRSFKVEPWVYKVIVSEFPLIGPSGNHAAGLHSWSDMQLIIGGDMPLRRRLEILLHEAFHAWRQHHGRPTDEESLCDQVASFATAFFRQLSRQGGERSLMQLTHTGVVDDSVDVGVSVNLISAECQTCRETFQPEQVVISRVQFDTAHGVNFVERSLYCDGCHHLQKWRELVNNAGEPIGRKLGAVAISHDADEIRHWIVEHGGRIGVRMLESEVKKAAQKTPPPPEDPEEPQGRRIVADPWG